MPFTRISLLRGKPPAYLRALADGLHAALVEAFEVPARDRFQAIDQREYGELIFDRDYLGGPRSDDFVLIEITTGRPRSSALKAVFFTRLAAVLHEACGLRQEDLMVIISTTGLEDWSFARGVSSMVQPAPMPQAS